MTPKQVAVQYGVKSTEELAKFNGSTREALWHINKTNPERLVSICKAWEKKHSSYAGKMKAAFIEGCMACDISKEQAELMAKMEGY